MALDTYEVVRELRSAGFEEAQADVLTRLFKRVGDIDLSGLATKADLAAAVSKLDAKIDGKADTIKAQLETRIEAAKTETIEWVVGLISLQTLVIVGTVGALVRGSGRL